MSLGRTDIYFCVEASSGWAVQRAAGELDVLAWRLHLIIGRAPKDAA